MHNPFYIRRSCDGMTVNFEAAIRVQVNYGDCALTSSDAQLSAGDCLETSAMPIRAPADCISDLKSQCNAMQCNMICQARHAPEVMSQFLRSMSSLSCSMLHRMCRRRMTFKDLPKE